MAKMDARCSWSLASARKADHRLTIIEGATMQSLIGGLSLAASLFLAAHASAEAISGFARGYEQRTYNSPGVALLDSFYFRYSNDDHHVTSRGVIANSQKTQNQLCGSNG